MRKVSFLFAVLVLLAGSSVAFGQRSAVMKLINQFVNGFNKAICSRRWRLVPKQPRSSTNFHRTRGAEPEHVKDGLMTTFLTLKRMALRMASSH